MSSTSRDQQPAPLRSRRTNAGAVLSISGEIFGLIVQVLLVCIGIQLALAADNEFNVFFVILWCILATVYVGLTIIGLNVMVWLGVTEPPFTRKLIGHPVTRLLSTALTFGTTALGLREAFSLIVNIGLAKKDPLVEISAIWAMLLAWAIFNWGYARIYYSRYHRASERSLIFPGTPEPRLTDFVYFAFTNATTFATSDVQITGSRMRWTVVWHTCFAFFFNALIIALTMNVISKGDLFAWLAE
ncbi:DUF1345 domain-containing protein [Paramicrobacterium chengjingii]|uniref:DUF1345 domain-containing protein n=1 Tax=Paramicrobacterium chengjingii TaxID=2769067 RepID=UPI001F1E00BD|nr:DUF1345 domain-containing protein [Microbacterium chengjingii]